MGPAERSRASQFGLAIRFVASLLCCAAWATPCSAYELATHAALTREAFLASRLNAAAALSASIPLLEQLGLGTLPGNLGVAYIDLARGTATERSAFPSDDPEFGQRKIDESNRQSSFVPRLPTLSAWLMLGAIREDDVPFDPGEMENSPQDEPHGTFTRVLNHFYDPYLNRSLTVEGVALRQAAPDWAIRGAEGSDLRENAFSIAAAREAMWRGLTLKLAPAAPFADGPQMSLGFVPTAAIPTREALRTAYWATTFRALGDAVHLLQDMAQPQHTRNDAHAGVGCAAGSCATGHKSYYEAYVESRVKGSGKFTLRERFYRTYGINDVVENATPNPIAFGGYPIPRFARYDDYFSTAIGADSTTGTGLANYSNQGFYSAGTAPFTAGAVQYPSPPASTAGLGVRTIPSAEVMNAAGRTIGRGDLRLLIGPVRDSFDGSRSAPAVALASEGAFDQFLNATGARHITLNHYNYAAQAELLLPRAVAYSAGLIDHFFRGTLEIGLPDEGVFAVVDAGAGLCKDTCGFPLIKLRLTNATPTEAIGPGIAVAVVKFHRNDCYRSDLSGEPGGPNFAGDGCRKAEEEIVVSAGRAIASLPSGATQALTFDFESQPIPINATDVTLQVVYRGRLGSEDDAVAVTTRNVAEPTYLAVENTTDYRYSAATASYVPSGAPTTFVGARATFGTAGKAVAGSATIPAPGYAQIAYLADRAGAPVIVDFAAANLSGGHPLTATLPAFEFLLPAGTGTVYASNWPVSRVRGMYRRFVYSVARTQGYEVYLCSPDFNPAACAEAGLPPLTTTHAVPWPIAF